MTEKIKQYLQGIYAPDAAEYCYEQIMQLVESFSERIPKPESRELFSEKNVVLITYGDSIQKPGEAPLKTLHTFVREYFGDLISTVHILPFFPYSSDDGFSILDYYQVNPALGDWGDIDRLADDFDLMVDAVFNHMSAQSQWFQSFLADEPESVGLFRLESPETDLSDVTRPRAHPLLTPFTKANGEEIHVWTTFSDDQVDFDVCYPNTLLRLIAILLFYIEHGTNMIRLDAIAYLWKEAGTSSIHLPETHLIIQLMRSILDLVAPHVLIVTETNVPHDENISYFGDGMNEAQMVYNFTLPPLLFHTLQAGDTTKLRTWVNSLSPPSDSTTFFNFTASHDGIGVRPVEGILDTSEVQALVAHTKSRGGYVSYKKNSDESESPYELNTTYVDAVTDPTEPLEMQVKRFLVSQSIMLVMAGVPGIYVHSLLGSHNYLEGVKATNRRRTINREKLQLQQLQQEVDDITTFRSLVFEGYSHLIRERIQHPAFHPNALQRAVNIGNDCVFALVRTTQDYQSSILTLHNVTNKTHYLNLGTFMTSPCRDLLTGDNIAVNTALEPYQIRWIEIEGIVE